MTDIYVGKSVNHFGYNEQKNNFHEIKYNMLQEKVLFIILDFEEVMFCIICMLNIWKVLELHL